MDELSILFILVMFIFGNFLDRYTREQKRKQEIKEIYEFLEAEEV